METTTKFAEVHAEEASGGQSSVPQDLSTDYHYTCFVQCEGADGKRLVELDGRRTGPVDRGASTDLLKASLDLEGLFTHLTDTLEQDAIQCVQDRYLSVNAIAAEKLSMIALCRHET